MNVHYREMYLFDDLPLEVKLPEYNFSLKPFFLDDPEAKHWTKKGQKRIDEFLQKQMSILPLEIWVIVAKWNTGNWGVGIFYSEPKIIN